MTTITIEAHNYKIIDNTQSDGRCFSAAIFYDLNSRQSEDNELNEWIQIMIIDPILAVEQSDCSKFFLWAITWAGLHNANKNADNNNNAHNKVMITNHIEHLQDIFLELENLKSHFEWGLLKPKNFDKNRMFEFLSNLTELIDTFVKNNDKYNTLTNILNDITELNNIILNDNISIKDLNNKFKYIYDNINTICGTDLQYDQDYKILIEKYKQYINSLNKLNIKNQYEWTEPFVGPLEILFNNTTIKSINIYNKNVYSKKFIKYPSTNPNVANVFGKDLYLYFVGGNHYKPLIPLNEK